MQTIYLEPRQKLDKAIIGIKNGVLIYSYKKLLDIYMDAGFDYIDGIVSIEYNIVGTVIKGWPIIYDDLNDDLNKETKNAKTLFCKVNDETYKEKK